MDRLRSILQPPFPSLSLSLVRADRTLLQAALPRSAERQSAPPRFPPLSLSSSSVRLPPRSAPSFPVLCLQRCSARLPEWSALFPAPLRRPDPLLSGRAEGEGGREGGETGAGREGTEGKRGGGKG